ncbi:hypothetical protein LTR12_018247 [Friedmanniomyces endolithicus]|nr:hypothetical protein LTR74_017684 [Friedmanniomyces endolithicus]KAK1807404.1 hypothetical protein LTR12_018247 [Friedmanniomyces endolithicus]
MFTTLSLPPRPVSKPFDFRFIPIDISHFQQSPAKRRRKRLDGPASQHSPTHGLTCSTHTSTPAIGPYAREESPGSQVRMPRPQATSSTTIQLRPAVSHAPTPSPHLLDNCGHVEALRDRLQPPTMPQHDAYPLPLLITPSPTGKECSASPVTDRVKHCTATAKQEPAHGLTTRILPATTLAPYDKRNSNGHALPISRRPMPARNIEVQCESADRIYHCRPGLVPATPDTVDDETASLNIPVSVKRRSNPIVLIRPSRTIREDHAQALDYRESYDLTENPPQMHVRDDDKGRRRLRPRSQGMQRSVRRRTNKGSRRSLAPSDACTNEHKAVGTVWSDHHDRRLLQLRSQNELPWKRIAGTYFGSTDAAWLRRRYVALTIGPLAQGQHPSAAGLRRSRRIDHNA